MSSTGATDYRPGGAYYTPLPIAQAMINAVAQELLQTTGRHRLRILDPSAGGGAFAIASMRAGLVRPGSMELMDLDPQARALQLPGGFVRTVAQLHPTDPVNTGFLITSPQQVPDAVVGNPPYGVPRPDEACPCGGRRGCKRCKGSGVIVFKRAIPVVREHIQRSLDVSRRYVLLLLRLGLLETESRQEWLAGTPLRHVAVLPGRPPFMQVCTACAGTGCGALPGAWQPPACPVCDGTGKAPRHAGGKAGGDSCAYGVFLWDHHHQGPPTIGALGKPPPPPRNGTSIGIEYFGK